MAQTDDARPARIEQTGTHGVAIGVTGQAGDIIVSVRAERFWTETFPPETTTTDDTLRGRSRSHLLAARHKVVPFDPRREDTLAELTEWRDQPGGLRVRLIHGPGGQGKTRLAMELAARSRTAGWAVARARHYSDPKPATAAVDTAALEAAKGLLVVIDYAERWPREDLLAVFRHRLLHQGAPTRVVLLARPAGWWWESLLHPLDDLDATADAVPLGSLPGASPDNRQAVFAAPPELDST